MQWPPRGGGFAPPVGDPCTLSQPRNSNCEWWPWQGTCFLMFCFFWFNLTFVTGIPFVRTVAFLPPLSWFYPAPLQMAGPHMFTNLSLLTPQYSPQKKRKSTTFEPSSNPRPLGPCPDYRPQQIKPFNRMETSVRSKPTLAFLRET